MKAPTNLRISPETEAELAKATTLSNSSKAELMRQAIAIGLAELRKIDYDLKSYGLAKLLEEKAAAPAPPAALPPPAATSTLPVTRGPRPPKPKPGNTPRA